MKKKNNVAVDIINFGEEGVNTAKLERFQSTINNHDNSHLVTISPGRLYEVVASSPILVEDGGFGAGVSGGDMDFLVVLVVLEISLIQTWTQIWQWH